MLTKSFTILVLLLCSQVDAQDKFKLTTVLPPQPSGPHEAHIEVRITGSAPALQPSDWSVTAGAANAQIPLRVLSSSLTQTSGFDLHVDTTPLATAAFEQFSWRLSIPTLPLVDPVRLDANATKSKTKRFVPAKGKTDADLYFFGSVLAGVGTKPLYVIDAKASPTWDLNDSGWSLGVRATIAANQSVSPPVSRSAVDPDSVTGSLLLHKGFDWHNQTYLLDLPVISGEFSRKYPASDLISAGSLQWAHPAYTLGKRLCQHENCQEPNCDPNCIAARRKHDTIRPQLAFYPSLGYEVGRNLNQPHQLFSRPVDLSRWQGIARVLPRVNTGLYLPGPNPTNDIPYRFTVTATYQPRIPLTLEPFVITIGSGTTAIQRTSLRKNTRHEVEASAAWNFTPFFGVALNYRYGSLPPLFPFVDHQVTLGLTFKGSFKHS